MINEKILIERNIKGKHIKIDPKNQCYRCGTSFDTQQAYRLGNNVGDTGLRDEYNNPIYEQFCRKCLFG